MPDGNNAYDVTPLAIMLGFRYPIALNRLLYEKKIKEAKNTGINEASKIWNILWKLKLKNTNFQNNGYHTEIADTTGFKARLNGEMTELTASYADNEVIVISIKEK